MIPKRYGHIWRTSKETFGEEVFKELEQITTDAGYNSEENCAYFELEGLTTYVK